MVVLNFSRVAKNSVFTGINGNIFLGFDLCEFQPGKLTSTAKITELNLFRALELHLFSKLKLTQVGNAINISL